MILAANDPLPSWRNTPTKQAILDFVATVTNTEGKGYVLTGDRLAAFKATLADKRTFKP